MNPTPRFRAESVLGELTSFQQDTVAHVTRRFFGPDRARRFLVADETGLGKTKVARGVIAHTIEQLQDDPSVKRIDIVYICSNADVAAQNLRRINITGSGELAFNSRIGLLSTHTGAFDRVPNTLVDKPINLVSFSPGTSFDLGYQWGRVDERALLYLLLTRSLKLLRETVAVKLLFAGQARVSTLESAMRPVDLGRVDPAFIAKFHAAVLEAGLDVALSTLVKDVGRRRSLRLKTALGHRIRTVIGDLRRLLATANVAMLEPDLVILDEFQRFHHLLDRGHGPASELAHQLFDFPTARVLLLSATPYKPFTYAEETADHHRTSFMKTLQFLAETDPAVSADAVAEQLDQYRELATTGQPVTRVAATLRATLTRVMTRQERPNAVDATMLVERLTPCEVRPDDLVDYVALRQTAKAVDADLAMDYWKSVPYFANFMSSYKVGRHVREAMADPRRRQRVADVLRRARRLDRDAVAAAAPIDLGNARLRVLAAQTTDVGWWRLLWLPPSLPYIRPEGPFAEECARTITKRLIFSAWSAAPPAIASLLSYEADRQLPQGSRSQRPLEYRGDLGAASLTTLAMFWPSPELATVADPLRLARWSPDGMVECGPMEEATLRNEVEPRRSAIAAGLGFDRDDAWLFAFAWPSAVPENIDVEDFVHALRGNQPDDDEAESSEPEPDEGDVEGSEPMSALERLVREAIGIREAKADGRRRVAETGVTLVRLALHAPGNVAWRALGRLVPGTDVTAAGHWKAAAILASGLRRLFNRPEVVALLGQLMPGEDYRSAVLRYCAWGNLQAVLDEYLHHLSHYAESITVTDDASLEALATVAREAIALRDGHHTTHDPLDGREIRFPLRFARRFGGRAGSEDSADESARQPEIRRAFNSPFWPFVLASTSVGQEGIDLHWWSHAVMHWNTPTNPVDFEQREGRVHRFCGHAVRRNIALTHRADILTSTEPDPWRAAYTIAKRRRDDALSDFAPQWVFAGPHAIERHLAPYPLSRDIDRLERVKAARLLYRLTFGQPRQEDMLELLRARGLHDDPAATDAMRIDLSPPPRRTL